MKNWTSLCLGLLLSGSTFAQTHFVPGYLLRKPGDTLRGYLQEEVQQEILHKIQFRQDLSDTPVRTYRIDELFGFMYSGGNQYRALNFINSAGDSARAETCFARLLVEGTFDLYAVMEDESLYFVIRSADRTYFLYSPAYASNGEVNREGNFTSRLEQIASICPNGHLRPDQVGFTQKEMTAFVLALDQCISPSTATGNFYHAAKKELDFSAYAGALPAAQAWQTRAGLELQLFYPQLGKKASLDLAFHYSSTPGVYRYLDYGNLPHAQLAMHQVISVPVTLDYRFFLGAVRPYAYVGFSGAYLKETGFYGTQYYGGYREVFGLAVVGALGVEVRATPHLYIVGDWRYELVLEYPTLGLRYQFN